MHDNNEIKGVLIHSRFPDPLPTFPEWGNVPAGSGSLIVTYNAGQLTIWHQTCCKEAAVAILNVAANCLEQMVGAINTPKQGLVEVHK